MALIDSQGRLFGKLSILDVGAMVVIAMVLIGIFLFPGATGQSVVNVTGAKPVEVEAMVKGLGARDPSSLFKAGDKTNLIIRNQPYGEIEIKNYQLLPRNIVVTQPDGSVKVQPNPLAGERFSNDMLVTLIGQAQETAKGLVLGNSLIKVGTVIELDGPKYNFKASVIDLRVQG
jgi:hypothetical protein